MKLPFFQATTAHENRHRGGAGCPQLAACGAVDTYIKESSRAAQILECGGKRSATPLWIARERSLGGAKAPSPLRSAGALQVVFGSGFAGPRAASRRGQAGILLGECLVYIAVWSVLLGLSFALFYKVLDNGTRLRRNAADIARALQAGERWREDIRRATGPIQVRGLEGAPEQTLHVPQASGELVYFFTGTNVLRRTGADTRWLEALGGVKASRMNKDLLGQLVAWRWEVELNAGKGKVKVLPLFTFQAVTANPERP